MLGHLRHASKTQFKWRFAGSRRCHTYSGICILPPLKSKTKKKYQGWIPSDKKFCIGAHACHYKEDTLENRQGLCHQPYDCPRL